VINPAFRALSTAFLVTVALLLPRILLAEDALPYSSTDDLSKARIAVLQGSVYDGLVSKRFPQSTLQQYLSLTDIIAAIKSGRADAGFTDEPPFKVALRTEPELYIVGEPLVRYPIGAGFRKDRTELRDAFNQFLRGLKASGDYDKLESHWLDHDGLPQQTVEPVASGEPLVIGTTIAGIPFVATRNNKLVGFDVTLGELFANSQNRPVRFEQMDFGALIAAANAGRIDMIMASMFITDERKKRIDFSDPYFELNGIAFARIGVSAASLTTEAAADTSEVGLWGAIKASFYDNLIKEDRYQLILHGLWITLLISLGATLLGTVFGGAICWLRMSSLPALNVLGRGYINLMRGIPVLVFLMLLYYVVLAPVRIDGITVSILALGLNFAAYAAEIYRTGLNSIDSGQREAGVSLGFSEAQTFRLILLPQTIRAILPVYKNEVISLVKMTSIVGYIAVQDLTKASDIIRARTFDAFFPLIFVAALYLLLVWMLISLLDRVQGARHPQQGVRP